MLSKICKKCNIEKILIEFYFDICADNYRSICKCCDKKARLERRCRNLAKEKEYRKNYYYANRLEEIRKSSEYERKRVKTDPNFKLRKILRQRIRKLIKNKSGSAVRDLGCSIEEFRKHIESKFKEGMTWENHGKWHLDHIKPLSLFNLLDREQFLQACHFTNLQPLWAEENLKKSDKYEERTTS
jgi:hypothetical protein